MKNQNVYTFTSPFIRAMQVGYIKKDSFIPGRLNFGVERQLHTFEATKESLKLPEIAAILKKYSPKQISTITVLRETLCCQLGVSLYEEGINNHFGDAYIGATHIKGDGEIRTAYLYENTEGLTPDGLWVIGESFCLGR